MKMKKQFIIICIMFLTAITSSAQTVLLNVDREIESQVSDRGPNLKKFNHFYLRAALVASSDNPGARIHYGTSLNFALGMRRKYKISPVYSLGFEIENQYTDYKLKQETGKLLPDTIINNISGRLDYATLGAGFYNRINFDPGRGNYMGTFFDAGIMGEWSYAVKGISKNKREDGVREKTISKQLPFVNNFNARVYSRLGFSHFSIFASYRITELFKPSFEYPDLPKLIAGFEIALY